MQHEAIFLCWLYLWIESALLLVNHPLYYFLLITINCTWTYILQSVSELKHILYILIILDVPFLLSIMVPSNRVSIWHKTRSGDSKQQN